MSLKIEKIKKSDVPEFYSCFKDIISNLDNKIYPQKVKLLLIKEYSQEKVPSMINDRVILLAKAHDSPIGFLVGNIYRGVFTIYLIGIRTFYRRKNVGSTLIDALIKECKKVKAHKIEILLIKSDKKTIEFFKKNKFKIEAIIKNFWDKEDYISLCKML